MVNIIIDVQRAINTIHGLKIVFLYTIVYNYSSYNNIQPQILLL